MSQDAWTPYSALSAASTNATTVKAATAILGGWALYNTNAAARYVKLYNTAVSPTVGTTVPTLRITVPGNTAGAGSNIAPPAQGISFSTGLSYAITTGAADSDATAVLLNEVVVNLFYQ